MGRKFPCRVESGGKAGGCLAGMRERRQVGLPDKQSYITPLLAAVPNRSQEMDFMNFPAKSYREKGPRRVGCARFLVSDSVFFWCFGSFFLHLTMAEAGLEWIKQQLFHIFH